MTIIKSPLRYPGGKSRAVNYLTSFIPHDIQEFREPFVGGGSMFLSVIQQYPNIKCVINDLNYDLYCFWKSLQDNPTSMCELIQSAYDSKYDGKKLFKQLCSGDMQTSEIERGARFFILNRITFSGTVDSGGFSQNAFEKRFTQSSIDRLSKLIPLMRSVNIYNEDYEQIINADGDNVFIFLDPPYYSTVSSRLYGKNGILHTTFDHERFADVMRTCKHKWMITYDDVKEVRDMFDFANISEFTLQYGMNNYMQKTARKGSEILIANYEL